MSKLTFRNNESPTIGVEIELQMVDAETFALRSSIETVLEQIRSREDCQPFEDKVKPELMQSYMELNTGVCKTVREAGDDLRATLSAVESVTDSLGLKLLWSATHPFSSWREQEITENPRYHQLVNLMQDIALRLVTFGLHVHVGVDTGDKAVMICDRMLRHLPLLLALSSNSPFWEGRDTGLHSNRSKIMEGLPTAGLPHQMRNWSEYVWLINHLKSTNFINTIREIWWDIRPHNNFGTVEIRICDMPANLEQVLSLTAMVQCLVQSISEEIDEGTYQSEYHPMMVAQNKWRATRFGPKAQLVNNDDYSQGSVQEVTDRLIDLLTPMGEQLDCVEELQSATKLPSNTGSCQQLKIFEHTNCRTEVVRQMIEANDWRN
ncbi:MAG: glutamate--cysteine ligase [Planctomycetaceae bacterium]|nr:glutamate--cysteine ligase [Planctomycetaceae bacterium]